MEHVSAEPEPLEGSGSVSTLGQHIEFICESDGRPGGHAAMDVGGFAALLRNAPARIGGSLAAGGGLPQISEDSISPGFRLALYRAVVGFGRRRACP